MIKQDGFYFIPQQWLGDSNILAMDWDCKGMHLHLMAIAWQQENKGYLIDDDNLLKKLLGNPPIEDWENRIKPQVFSAWKKKAIKENGTEKQYWYQPGILKTLQLNNSNSTISTPKKTRTKKSNGKLDILADSEMPDTEGFNLLNILKAKPAATILYKKPITATQEEKNTIWTLGVQMIKSHSGNEMKARGFLAKLIKEYGDKAVASAIAQISMKNLSPAEIHSYLVGMLKKQQAEIPIKKTGRGNVSI
jgi:hypothetical protein